MIEKGVSKVIENFPHLKYKKVVEERENRRVSFPFKINHKKEEIGWSEDSTFRSDTKHGLFFIGLDGSSIGYFKNNMLETKEKEKEYFFFILDLVSLKAYKYELIGEELHEIEVSEYIANIEDYKISCDYSKDTYIDEGEYSQSEAHKNIELTWLSDLFNISFIFDGRYNGGLAIPVGSYSALSVSRIQSLIKDYVNYRENGLSRKEVKMNEISKLLPLQEISFGSYSIFERKEFAIVRSVADKYVFIDYFVRAMSSEGIDNTYKNSHRVIIAKDAVYTGVISFDKNLMDNKFITRVEFSYITYLIDDDVYDNPSLRYYKDILLSTSSGRLGVLLGLIQDPIFEQLVKMGYKDIVNIAINNNFDRAFQKNIKIYFGIEHNRKPKNINKRLGLNKYQIQKISKSGIRTSIPLPSALKYMNVMQELNDLDNKTFDTSLELLELYAPRYGTEPLNENGNYFSSSGRLIRQHRIETMEGRVKQFQEECLKVFKETQSLKMLDHYVDFVAAVRKYNDLVGEHPISIKFQGVLEMEALFLEVNAALETYRNKAAIEKFKARTMKLNKYGEYESELHNYKVLVPQQPSELVVEGASLKHCVGGYVNSFANGETNIFFIRDKDDDQTPLYTLEYKKGMINQARGMKNSEVPSDVREFVKLWAEETNARKEL